MAKNDFDELMSIGIDIGKETFQLAGFDQARERVLRKQIKHLALVATFEKLPRCMVGMEACLSAHFVSRTLRKLGFEPRIIPAIYVKPFNKGQKNDCNDAEAIAEAALRPNLKAVSEKSQDRLARPASFASCAITLGVAPNCDDQSDPDLLDRAGHHCTQRSARFEEFL